ncbi:MAG: hypothetical protein CMI09_03845 [Oceanospirillaceae bacterium]|nr:hypothetical protein [Oceanospirillaceae bacterium]
MDRTLSWGWLGQWLSGPLIRREIYDAERNSEDTTTPVAIDLLLADLACDLACCQQPAEQLTSLLVPAIAWFQRPLAQHQARFRNIYLPVGDRSEPVEIPLQPSPSENVDNLDSGTINASHQCWIELPLGNYPAATSSRATPEQPFDNAGHTGTRAWLQLECPAEQQPQVRKLLAPLQRTLVRGLSGWLQHQQQLAAERRDVIERERRWQAAELHDSVAQVLGYVRLRSAQLATRCHETGSDVLIDHAEDLSQQCHHAYRQTRELIAMSRLAIQGEQFLPALRDAIQDLESRSTLVFELDNRCDALQLSDVEATQALYIVREALCNVVRHARASHARVKIYQSCGQRILLVEDNGCGIQRTRQQGSFGLQIMAERAQRMGGKLVIRKRQPNGTRIELVLPAASNSAER